MHFGNNKYLNAVIFNFKYIFVPTHPGILSYFFILLQLADRTYIDLT